MNVSACVFYDMREGLKEMGQESRARETSKAVFASMVQELAYWGHNWHREIQDYEDFNDQACEFDK